MKELTKSHISRSKEKVRTIQIGMSNENGPGLLNPIAESDARNNGSSKLTIAVIIAR
jgi:hypothetical protein